MTIASETIIHMMHTIECEDGKHFLVKDSRGKTVCSTHSRRDAFDAIHDKEAEEYNTLRPELVRLLKDYLRKLERDDYDPAAIGKMKTTAVVLDKLQGGM